MSSIDEFLKKILASRYGKDVRQSIHDAIEKIDEIAEGAQTGATASASEAKASASEASSSESNASASATDANNSYLSSRSYAVGGTGTREGEDTDNSYYYYQKVKAIASGSGLIPSGTITFAEIPTKDLVRGEMYNIKDAFTSDERFADGAGIDYPAGTNIYWIDDKWDVMSPDMSNYLLKTGDTITNTTTFTDSASMENLKSGETHGVLFGKISTALKTLAEKISALADKLTTDEGNIATAQSNIKTLQSDLATTNGNVSALADKLTTDEGNIATAQSNIKTLQSDLATTNGNVSALENSLDVASIPSDLGATAGGAIAQLNTHLTEKDSLRLNGLTTNIKFGIDSDGNYGYIKAGADTVIPFSDRTLLYKDGAFYNGFTQKYNNLWYSAHSSYGSVSFTSSGIKFTNAIASNYNSYNGIVFTDYVVPANSVIVFGFSDIDSSLLGSQNVSKIAAGTMITNTQKSTLVYGTTGKGDTAVDINNTYMTLTNSPVPSKTSKYRAITIAPTDSKNYITFGCVLPKTQQASFTISYIYIIKKFPFLF